jgi:ornithine cyclodeaminase/alanine dehydrogenase-like protein (mu-crystallin family)
MSGRFPVVMWARRTAAPSVYASAWKEKGLGVKAMPEIRDAVENADVVITTTPVDGSVRES